MASVSIKGLSRALVFAALYNAARPRNIGIFFLKIIFPPKTIKETTEEMRKHKINETDHFDFKTCLLVKVEINQNTASSVLYDAFIGQGAMLAIVKNLYENRDPNSRLIRHIHKYGYVGLFAALDHDMDEAYGA